MLFKAGEKKEKKIFGRNSLPLTTYVPLHKSEVSGNRNVYAIYPAGFWLGTYVGSLSNSNETHHL